MIKAHLGDPLDRFLQRQLGVWLRRAPPPLVWSVVGVGCALAAGVAFADAAWRTGSLWIAASSVCDLFDGPVARAQGRASPRGAFVDSCCDRVSDLAIYLCVMIGLAQTQPDATGLLVVAAVALASAQLTSYLKARAEHWLPSLEGGIFERGERLAVLGVGTFFAWVEAALWVLAAAGLLTVATRFASAWRDLPLNEVAGTPVRPGYARDVGGEAPLRKRPDSEHSAGGGVE